MKRSSFIKTLLGIAIAPKVLGEVKKNFETSASYPIGTYDSVVEPKSIFSQEFKSTGRLNKKFISAIDFLDRRELNSALVEKYGDKSFFEIRDYLGTHKVTNHDKLV